MLTPDQPARQAVRRPEGRDWIGVGLLILGAVLIAGTTWLAFMGVIDAALALACVALEAFSMFAVGYELWPDLVSREHRESP